MTKSKSKTNPKPKPSKKISNDAGTISAIKPRNPAALNPLLRKGHVHEKPGKTVRSRDKQKLRKQLSESNQDD